MGPQDASETRPKQAHVSISERLAELPLFCGCPGKKDSAITSSAITITRARRRRDEAS